MRSISEIAEEYGVKMTESENRHGSIFTTPEWDDWPQDMLDAVESEGWSRQRGPEADYWIGDDE